MKKERGLVLDEVLIECEPATWKPHRSANAEYPIGDLLNMSSRQLIGNYHGWPPIPKGVPLSGCAPLMQYTTP